MNGCARPRDGVRPGLPLALLAELLLALLLLTLAPPTVRHRERAEDKVFTFAPTPEAGAQSATQSGRAASSAAGVDRASDTLAARDRPADASAGRACTGSSLRAGSRSHSNDPAATRADGRG